MVMEHDDIREMHRILDSFEEGTELEDAVKALTQAAWILLGINEDCAAQSALEVAVDLISEYIEFIYNDGDWESYDRLNEELIVYCYPHKHKLSKEEFYA